MFTKDDRNTVWGGRSNTKTGSGLCGLPGRGLCYLLLRPPSERDFPLPLGSLSHCCSILVLIKVSSTSHWIPCAANWADFFSPCKQLREHLMNVLFKYQMNVLFCVRRLVSCIPLRLHFDKTSIHLAAYLDESDHFCYSPWKFCVFYQNKIISK